MEYQTMSVQSADEVAIRAAALDYAEGWFDGDTERMERSLHPNLAKRALKYRADSGEKYLVDLNKDIMVRATGEGGGRDVPRDKLYYKVDILDVYEEVAIVRVESYPYLDYLQLLKDDGQWLIVNVLYTSNRANTS
jgi:hypothetical protein